MKYILYSYEMDNFIFGINHRNQTGRLVFDSYEEAEIYNELVWDGEASIMELNSIQCGDIKYNISKSQLRNCYVCWFD